MAAMGTSFYPAGWYMDANGVVWATSGPGYYPPPPSDYKTVYREQFDALTKQRKREAVAARTRTVLRAVARQQALQARHEIEARRPFMRPVGKRQTERARRRQFA